MAIIPNNALAKLKAGELALGFGVQHLRSVATPMLAKAAGYDLRVSLEASIGFAQRGAPGGKAEKTRKLAPRSSFEMSANDRRFLKSLRISADEPTEKVD